MLNQIDVQGRLTKDPEARYTQNEKLVATFTVACERDFKDRTGDKVTDFFDCVAWNNTGEFISKNFHKGDMIVVSGRLQKREWEDKTGNKRQSAEIIVERGYFCGSKKEATPSTFSESKFNDIAADDFDLPF